METEVNTGVVLSEAEKAQAALDMYALMEQEAAKRTFIDSYGNGAVTIDDQDYEVRVFSPLDDLEQESAMRDRGLYGSEIRRGVANVRNGKVLKHIVIDDDGDFRAVEYDTITHLAQDTTVDQADLEALQRVTSLLEIPHKIYKIFGEYDNFKKMLQTQGKELDTNGETGKGFNDEVLFGDGLISMVSRVTDADPKLGKDVPNIVRDRGTQIANQRFSQKFQ